MSFFKNFPTIKYDLNETGELIDVKNLFKHVDVNDIGIDSNISYTYYEIQSGERPDTVSQRLYGTTDYYWTFFILNDYLKEGLRAWPKSEQELERYITNEHDDHGVLVIPQEFDNPTSTLAGLDLTHPYLRVRRDDLTNAYALVDGYDPQTYQLKVYKVSNDYFFTNPSRIRLEVYNPYNPADGDNYQAVEALNLEWIASTYEWAEKNHFDVYDLFNGSYAQGLSLETSRTAFLNEWYNFAFGNSAGPYFTYNTPFNYELGRNAPYQYLNAANEPITAYDALVTDPGIPEYVTLDNIQIQSGPNAGQPQQGLNGQYDYYPETNDWRLLWTGNNGLDYINVIVKENGQWVFYYGYGDPTQQITTLSATLHPNFWQSNLTNDWTGALADEFNSTALGGGASWSVPFTGNFRSGGSSTASEPKSITVVEYEREKNFAKRKIRVVKKSQIQEFVEEYRNLIQD